MLGALGRLTDLIDCKSIFSVEWDPFRIAVRAETAKEPGQPKTLVWWSQVTGYVLDADLLRKYDPDASAEAVLQDARH